MDLLRSEIVKDHCFDMLLFWVKCLLFCWMSCALVHFLSCSGGSPASSYSSSHFLFIYLIDSSFFFTLLFNIFLSSLPLRLVLIGLFPCFFILTTMMVCDWLRCVMWPHVPPTCPLASCLQWAALSGLWVWALAPQALQPLAGCTGAFPGQVLSTTCVPPPPSWCSVFLLTCSIQWSASTNWKWLSIFTWLSLYPL